MNMTVEGKSGVGLGCFVLEELFGIGGRGGGLWFVFCLFY